MVHNKHKGQTWSIFFCGICRSVHCAAKTVWGFNCWLHKKIC